MLTGDKNLRILHIIASVDPATGGPIEGILRQDEATRELGQREILTLDPPDATFLSEMDIPVHAVGDRSRPIWRRGFLSHYRYTPQLIPWIKANIASYDAVIVNGLWNYAAFGAAMTLPGSSTPYFVFTHGMLDPWFARTNPLKHVAKVFFWLFCEGRLLAGAHAVLFTTEEERRLAHGQFPLWRYKEQVVGYGSATPPEPCAAQSDAFGLTVPNLGARSYLLFLSRIHRKKGCDLLVEAFAKVAEKHPDLDLVIAGPNHDGWISKLQARAQALGIGHRIHWPGMLRGDAKWGAYRGAQAFILPSHQENFGIVVAEALSCGIPVLITDKVNIWREIEAGGGGLVETDTQTGIDRLVERWLAISDAARAEIGAKALAVFNRHFNILNVAPSFLRSVENTINLRSSEKKKVIHRN